MAKNKELETTPETVVKRPGGYNMEPIQSAEEEKKEGE
jgi:hypothetical protein